MSRRKKPTRNNNGALSKTKEIAGENKQLGTKKGEAIASNKSHLLKGVAGEGMVGDDHDNVVAADLETVKKVAREVSNTISLLDKYSHLRKARLQRTQEPCQN